MKIFSRIIVGISIIVMLWFAVSTIEVGIKNKAPNPQYSSINMWNILVEFGTEYHNIGGNN